jgi:hypothetical protein
MSESCSYIATLETQKEERLQWAERLAKHLDEAKGRIAELEEQNRALRKRLTPDVQTTQA